MAKPDKPEKPKKPKKPKWGKRIDMARNPIYMNGSVSNNTVTLILQQNIELVAVHVDYTSDATAGTRTVELEIRDEGGNKIIDFHAAADQNQSENKHYEFLVGVARDDSFKSDHMVIGLPVGIVVQANWRLVMRDSAGVSTGDSFNYDVLGNGVV